MKISCWFEISCRPKWPIWNPYRFEFHFAPIHVNTSKELTELWSEILNRNEISYRFDFISPLMWWTYSKSENFSKVTFLSTTSDSLSALSDLKTKKTKKKNWDLHQELIVNTLYQHAIKYFVRYGTRQLKTP